MEEKLGREPAFSCVTGDTPNGYLQEGMSKRFYAACIAMQGILTSSNDFMYKSGHTAYSLFNKVEFAYECADELLRQENL